MRILEVNALFPPEWWGGAENYVLSLSKALMKRGHSVFVIAGTKKNYTDIHEKTFDNLNIFLIPRFQEFYHYQDDRANALFTGLIDRIKPDVVHFHNFFHYLPASFINEVRRFRIPIIQHLHDYWFICPIGHLMYTEDISCSGPQDGIRCIKCPGTAFIRERMTRRNTEEELNSRIRNYIPAWLKSLFPCQIKGFLKEKMLSRKISEKTENNSERSRENRFFMERNKKLASYLSQSDRIIVPSKYIFNIYYDWLNLKGSFNILPIGTDVVRYTADKKKSSKFRFAYVGALAPHKGVHILINAFRKMKNMNVSLSIWGTGDIKYSRLLRKLANSDSRISFCDVVAHSEINRAFQNIDVLIAPSVWQETFGMNIREAFASGTVVIASDIGAYSEAIRHGEDGFLFTPGDEKDLLDCMNRLAGNRDLMKSMIKRIPAVQDIKDNALAIEKIMKQCTAGRTASPGRRPVSRV